MIFVGNFHKKLPTPFNREHKPISKTRTKFVSASFAVKTTPFIDNIENNTASDVFIRTRSAEQYDGFDNTKELLRYNEDVAVL